MEGLGVWELPGQKEGDPEDSVDAVVNIPNCSQAGEPHVLWLTCI